MVADPLLCTQLHYNTRQVEFRKISQENYATGLTGVVIICILPELRRRRLPEEIRKSSPEDTGTRN